MKNLNPRMSVDPPFVYLEQITKGFDFNSCKILEIVLGSRIKTFSN